MRLPFVAFERVYTCAGEDAHTTAGGTPALHKEDRRCQYYFVP
jgi:hypothetical protein